MASNTARSLSSLLQNASLDDHEEFLKAANVILKRSKADIYAQQIRAIALLKLDRYEEALREFEDAGEPLQKQAPLPFAYALYKTGQLKRASKIARTVEGAVTSKHIEAQAAYRSEDFERAAELYDELSGRTTWRNGEASDIRINRGATDAQLTWARLGHLARRTKAERGDLEQFETAFNAACGYVARGDLKQADLLLRRAKDLCTTADELSEDEKKVELLPIIIQHIYVLSQLGKHEEAESLCATINISDISDQATRHIAQANLLAASSKPSNPYFAHRLLQAVSQAPTRDLPFKFQISALDRNRRAVDLKIGKASGVAESSLSMVVQEAQGSVAPGITSASVFYAAAHVRSSNLRAAVKELMPLLEKRPNDVGLLLTIVQLHLRNHNLIMATSLLEAFLGRLEHSGESTHLDARYAPGIVALLVALNGSLNRPSQIKANLAYAASHWREKTEDVRSFATLYKAAGAALLDSPTAEDLHASHQLFEAVYAQDKSDRVAIAGLAASAEDVTTTMKDLEDDLPSLGKLIVNVDAAQLEQAGIGRRPVDLTKKRLAPVAEVKAGKHKKSKKSKTPMNYDAAKDPDPERWLPLRDRSNWRPKGKRKGRVAGGMATQGGFASEDSRPATPNSQVVQSKARKKKGKGIK